MQLSTVLRVHAFFLWLLAAHWSADAAEMHQRSHVKVSSGVVRLSDVVTTRGGEEGQFHSLLKTELCPAPSGEKSLRINRQDLLQLLALNEVEVREWKFSGAEETIIVRQQAKDVVPVAAEKEIPATKPAVDTPPQNAAQSVRVVAALRPISRGEIVRDSDVELIPAKDDKTAARAFQTLDDVLGKEAKRLIPAGYPVDASHVQRPQLVKRNEQVTIRAKAAGVTVTVSGVAKEDGAAGDVVSVTPEGSKDVILARVTGLRQLEVFASGPRY